MTNRRCAVLLLLALLCSVIFSGWLIISIPTIAFQQLENGRAVERLNEAHTQTELKNTAVDLIESSRAGLVNARVVVYACLGFNILTCVGLGISILALKATRNKMG